MDLKLEPGDVVRVDLRGIRRQCEVIYCQPEGERYIAGLILKQWINKAELDKLFRDLGRNRDL